MPDPIEGLVLSSTTDTQDQVNEAAGIKAVEAPATEEVETDAATETAETVETQKPKAKGGFQKKIDKLTSRITATESRAEAAERRAQEAEARLAERLAETAPRTEPAKKEERPKLADFNGDADKWFDARVEWDKKQAAIADEEAERREAFDNYQANKEETKLKHEDWDD